MALVVDFTGALASPPFKALITIQQADLTFITGTLWELDTDAFRLELKTVEDDETGIVFGDTHAHTTDYTVAGVTYARSVLMLAEVQFEDTGSAYSVRLAGSNNDIFDVEEGIFIPTPLVTVIAQNSAGLIVVGTSGLTAAESSQLNAINDGVYGQKVMRDSIDVNTLPGFLLLYDDAATPVLIGHKELFQDEAKTLGWIVGKTIKHEGPLVAGAPPP